MKVKRLYHVMFLLCGALLAVSCEKVGQVVNTECAKRTRAEGIMGHPTLKLTREGSNIYCELTDYEVNCAYGDIQVSCKEKGNKLHITVDQGLDEIVVNCLCPINIYFSIFDTSLDEYQLTLDGKEIGIASFKEHQVVLIDLWTLEIAHEEGFEYPLKAIDFYATETFLYTDLDPCIFFHNYRDRHYLSCSFRNFRLFEGYTYLNATAELDEDGTLIITILSDGSSSSDYNRFANLSFGIVNYEEKPYHLKLRQTIGKMNEDVQFVGEQTLTLYEGEVNFSPDADNQSIPLSVSD